MMNLDHAAKNNSCTVFRVILILLVTFTIFARPTQAAFCSLRDPVVAIQMLYPLSNNYRSLVRPVTQNAREEISQKLPFTLHFNEIGQHTLFVALNKKTPVGFVHARSELSRWGLIELAWAVNLDMTIEGLIFQRCRSPRCNNALSEKISKHLRGKSFEDLLGLMSANNSRLNQNTVTMYGEDHDLVLSIIRSALKTLAITDISWGDDITDIRRESIVRDNLQFDKQFELRKVDGLAEPITLDLADTINRESMIDPESIEVHLVLENSREIGRLVEAKWRQGKFRGEVLWLFSPDGIVLDIQSKRKWNTREVATAFGEIVGQHFNKYRTCSSATEMAGRELYFAGFR